MSRSLLILLLVSLLVSCAAPISVPTSITIQSTEQPALLPTPSNASPFPSSVSQVPAATSPVPAFEHIVLIVFENKDFGAVIDNAGMPQFNQLAQENTLLTQFYAIRHPSLPNYLAMIGGDTFGIDSDCTDCFVDARSLPDLIEASGRTWKTYQESMPVPCYLGESLLAKLFKDRYAQKHNPFVYFDSIRTDPTRCENSVVPLTQLDVDIEAGTLPNFIFISPNMCNDAHNCSLEAADAWLENLHNALVPVLESTGQPYLIVLTFDEGKGNQSCCGLPEVAGGRIPVVLISPLAKKGFQDETPYTHYSLLKTIAASWNLPYLGHAADESTSLITAPWK